MFAFLRGAVKSILRIDRRRSRRWFLADEEVFWKNTHEPCLDAKAHAEAWIVIQYHVIEKGLTMPNRRLAFGKNVVLESMDSIDEYEARWKVLSSQVVHAIGVVKAYYELHLDAGYDFSDDLEYWRRIRAFMQKYQEVPVSKQEHKAYADFYAATQSAFPIFARSRHTLRNYSGESIPKDRIVESVKLAMTAPSACNRQHVRVHCIADKKRASEILEVQGGNRGFGHLADKVLIVTVDVSAEMGERERNNPYVNGGIFLMNLCYALHYNEIAHCVLSCSIELSRISKIRALASIPEREIIVSMLSCGIAPKEFDIASSPRKDVSEILSYKE